MGSKTHGPREHFVGRLDTLPTSGRFTHQRSKACYQQMTTRFQLEPEPAMCKGQRKGLQD